MPKNKSTSPPPPELKKGMLLVFKAPPFYTKSYLYEVTSAGDKLVRASLYHSPTVKKSWNLQEIQMLFEHGILRIASDEDVRQLNPAGAPEQRPYNADDDRDESGESSE